MIERFFDFEVTPNWWLLVTGDMPADRVFDETIKDTFTIISSDMPDARERMIEVLREPDHVMIGYNVKCYDLMIANAIYQGFSPQQVKIVNDLIIDPKTKFASKEHIRLQSFAKRRMPGVVYQDLFDDDNGGSLKDKEGLLGLSVLESEVDFNTENMMQEQKDDMTYYCKHDVYSTMEYFVRIREVNIKAKLAISKAFNIPIETCYKHTNAQVCALVLGAKRTNFADELCDSVELPEHCRQYIYDALGTKLVDEIRNNPYYFDGKSENPKSKTIEINVFNNVVTFGNGGVHSYLAKCLYVESDDEWVMVNLDVASFYPSLLIFFRLLSRAVKNPAYFKEIFEERLKLKAKKNKTFDDDLLQQAYKLVLNTTYGASGNKYLDLYDRYHCLSTCRVGQLLLTALAATLYKKVPGFQVIQSNTDGILAYFRRKDYDLVKKLCDEWSEMTQMLLEYDEVEKIWQRDVNNYLLIKKGGKQKSKGGWLSTNILNIGCATISGLSGFVAAKAAKEWLLNKKNIVETIVNERDPYNFMYYCKKGPTYSGVVQRMSNGQEIKLFKGNRVIMTNDERYGCLYKTKRNNKTNSLSYTKMPEIGEHCIVVNDDVKKYNIDELKQKIDYMFYITEALDKLNIEWTELKDGSLVKTHKFDYEI